MKEGILIYDSGKKRIDVRFGLEEYYGGLNCGECFDVMINRKWVPTRIELAEDWYLVGIDKEISMMGLRARLR